MKKVYTTGQIARLCMVAPRTVAKWFDSGNLKGYRIPGSMDRRIPDTELIAFLQQNNMSEFLTRLQFDRACVFVGISPDLWGLVTPPLHDEGIVTHTLSSLFHLGLVMRDKPRGVILNSSVGRRDEVCAAGVGATELGARVLVILGEDADERDWVGVKTIPSPVNHDALAKRIIGWMD